MEHSGFPSHETLAAFVDDRLDAATRRRVVEHMAACDECRGAFVTATLMRGERSPAAAETESRRPGRALPIAVLAAALVVASVVFGWMLHLRRRPEPLPPGVDRLIAATDKLHVRLMDARISGFPYRQLRKTMREVSNKEPSTWEIYGAASEVAKGARPNDPAGQHALGVSHLALGNYREAVAALEKAIKLETGQAQVGAAISKSTHARLLSDLSAAYYGVATRTDDHMAIVSAVDAAEAAWKIDPHLPEAAWNRAVAREEFHSGAIAAWQDYLRLDSKSQWADEARDHLRRLEVPPRSKIWEERGKALSLLDGASDEGVRVARQLADEFPQETREEAQKALLPAWGAALLAGDTKAAARRLGIVQAIAASLAERGDLLLSRTTAAIRTSSDLPRLARGLVAYREGMKLYEDGQVLEASERFAESAERMTGTSFAAAAEYQRARCDFSLNDYDRTLERLGAISTADLDGSHSLRGGVNWLKGLTLTVMGQPNEALAAYQTARVAFQTAAEAGNELAVESLIAINEGYVGADGAAWARRLVLLQHLARLGDSPREYIVLSDIARAAARQGHMGVATIMADEAVGAANRRRQPDLISDAHLNRGLVFHLAGDDGAARYELQWAEDWKERILDPRVRARIAANIELTSYDWRSEEPPAVSIERLTESIRFYEQTKKQYYLARLLFLRAQLRCRTGDVAGCSDDLKVGIATAASELGDLADPVMAGTYVDTMHEATDSLASLLVRREEVGEALQYVDCSRLLVASGSAQPVRCAAGRTTLIEAVQRRLPAGAALIEVEVLDGQLLSWIITRDGSRADRRALPASLENDLLEPFADELRGLRTLIVVPDPERGDVSPAALRSPVTGHHLIEDMRLVVTPSAATFAASSPGVAPHGRTLVVCNAFDSSGSAGLEPLPRAHQETETVSAIYGGAEVLENATRKQFLDAAGEAAIVHFAGHSVPNPDAPLFAALALAPEDRYDSGRLFARDIARARFPRTSIVILSACDAAAPARGKEGGVTNIARAFLAAGVPAVIASTSPVDDTWASEMFQRVHDGLVRGAAPVDALRAAQVDLIRRGAPRSAWAGFQYLGTI